MALNRKAFIGVLLSSIFLPVLIIMLGGQLTAKQAEDGTVVFAPADSGVETPVPVSSEAVEQDNVKGTKYTLPDGTTYFIASDPLDQLAITLKSQNLDRIEQFNEIREQLAAAVEKGESDKIKQFRTELDDLGTRSKIDTLYFSVDAFIDSYKLQSKEIAAMRMEIQELKKLVASMAK